MIDNLPGRDLLPDCLIRLGIGRLLRQRRHEIRHLSPELKVRQFAESLPAQPIAIYTTDSKEQHYEVPTAFYQHCPGPRPEYSSAPCEGGAETPAQAGEAMFALTCARAELQDGIDILEPWWFGTWDELQLSHYLFRKP